MFAALNLSSARTVRLTQDLGRKLMTFESPVTRRRSCGQPSGQLFKAQGSRSELQAVALLILVLLARLLARLLGVDLSRHRAGSAEKMRFSARKYNATFLLNSSFDQRRMKQPPNKKLQTCHALLIRLLDLYASEGTQSPLRDRRTRGHDDRLSNTTRIPAI